MILVAVPMSGLSGPVILSSVVMFVGTAAAVYAGWRPARALFAQQERQLDVALRGRLLLDVSARLATGLSIAAILLPALLVYWLTGSLLGGVIGLAVGAVLPTLALRYLKHKRLARLEDQLVDGVQTLSSGVRAGLNLVQAMELVARDGPVPLRQEFRHLLREYEYGVPLEEAMSKAAGRIGSGDFRLLFAALRTHRDRGGDLGETLDRIAASIREIQRLENRVKALTAQGRATARFMGAMPVVVMLILYLIQQDAVRAMFADNVGKVMILAIVVLNVIGFLWIRKIVSLDI